MRTALLLLPVLAAAGVAVYLVSTSRAPAPESAPPTASDPELATGAPPPAAAATYRPVEPESPEILTDHKVAVPLHVTSAYPPGTRIEIRELPKVERGIIDGQGTVLPFLNGMTWAPAIKRNPLYGPVPPVRAIVVDAGGFEWYEHADGSVTTCRYREVVFQGETSWDPCTEHSAKVPERLVRDRRDDEPTSGGR